MLAASASVLRLPVGYVERPIALQVCSCPPCWRQPRKWSCKHERPQVVARAAAPIVDRTIFVKISMASMKNALDLESMDLDEIPPEVFDIRDLKDLTLAGNRITELPEAIGRLTSLERLQLSGNLLTKLPDAIGKLTRLKGLWLHGNLLESIPDSIGDLENLEILSLAGNCLTVLPEGIGNLAALQDLGVSGNELRALPVTIGKLKSLRKFACNGNMLEELPYSLGNLSSLSELWLQGNQLRNIDSFSSLENLVTFSAADNPTLQELPSLQHLTALKSLELYGCGLTSISLEVVQLPALRSIWLEGNPLKADSLAPLLSLFSENTALRDLGLDKDQVVGIADDVMELAAKQLRLGEVASGGCGYFKIVSKQNLPDGVGGDSGESFIPQSSLVVAFGSAPGVPNWGGLLKRVEKAGSTQADWGSFDILFVVDGSRSWYSGGDEGVSMYNERLQAICKRYKTVVMLGDSMGASAALLFAPAATAVLAFCPQVDLSTSSIRPGKSQAWLDVLKENILNSVREAASLNVNVMVHSGSWEHDVQQARNLPKEHAQLKVHLVDSHRLAFYLDKHEQLVPLVLKALKQG